MIVKQFIKLYNLCTIKEKKKFFFLITLISLVSFLEVLFALSLLPFIALLSNPDLINTNHQINNVDFTFTPAKVIDGCGYEIISLSALKFSHKNGKKKHRSELCSLYIRENKKKFICTEVITPNYLLRDDLRLTIDIPEDLILCRAIYKNIKNKKLKKIIKFLDKNKNLKKLCEKILLNEI